MTLWSCYRLLAAICGAIWLTWTPLSSDVAHAQAASQGAPASDKPASDSATAGNAATDQGGAQAAGQAQPKSFTAAAIDKVRAAAKSASDIFSRVPCLPPKGGVQSLGSLPHVAKKLVDGEPVVIIAF